MKPPLAFCLAVSHVDYQAALLWLRWAAFLAKAPACMTLDLWLVIVLTKRTPHIEPEIHEIVGDGPRFFTVSIVRLEDEDERGYPGSSSHLFVRSLEACRREVPEHAVQFIEPDCIPVQPHWAHTIQRAYQSAKQPFIGLHVRSTNEAISRWGFPAWHLTGNAIYPPNAFELAPSLRDTLVGTLDNCPWKDKGWAWDLFSAHEVIPQSEQTDAIQQVWRSDPWTPQNIHRISKRAALLHQSKDGSLIYNLALRDCPEFFDTLPNDGTCYQLDTGDTHLSIAGLTLDFTATVRGAGGRIIAVYRPRSPLEAALLRSSVGRRGVRAIPEADYRSLLRQAGKLWP